VWSHPPPEGQKAFVFGRNGSERFEILPELAILTSNILGFYSSTTLMEKTPTSFRAATSVTRPRPHSGGEGRPTLGEG
jgi:hypothetical protein